MGKFEFQSCPFSPRSIPTFFNFYFLATSKKVIFISPPQSIPYEMGENYYTPERYYSSLSLLRISVPIYF